jgi:DNA/RNA endonuclease YhcR with UshA esterase domain
MPGLTLPPGVLRLALVASLAAVTAVADDEPAGRTATLERAAPTAIAPQEALSHVGEECTVEFVVENGRKLDDKDVCFLNSLKDHREKGNFTAVIFRDALARFAADGVDNPADEFMGKTIRVSGLVAERSGQAQIVVESPTQIEVVEAAEAVSPDAQDR